MAQAATAYIDVVPDFSGFKSAVMKAINGLPIADVKIDADTGSLKSELKGAVDESDKAGKKAGDQFGSKFGDGLGQIGEKAKAAAAGAGIAAAGALGVGLAGAIDAEAATSKLKAQLGLTAKESKSMGKLAGNLYSNAYGGSLDEVNDALRQVVVNVDGMRGASTKSLKGITASVLDVSTAFDQDLGGVTRAVGKMMRTGLAKDGREALDIITRGFQTGADSSEDFLDTLNEYSTQFRKVGLDGKTATGLLSQGLKGGARDADIVADAIGEFTKRAVDGSKTTADGFKSLGMNAGNTADLIAAGGPKASKALDMTLDRLRAIKDPSERAAVAVQLFGTQAEDLGDALFALDPSKAAAGLGKVGGAATQMGKDLNDNAKTNIETFKRQALMGLTNIVGAHVLPALERVGPAVQSLMGAFNGAGSSSGALQGTIGRLGETFQGVVPIVENVTAVASAAWARFGGVITAQVQAVAVFVGKYLGSVVVTLKGVTDFLSGVFTGDWGLAWQGIKGIFTGVWQAMLASLQLILASMKNAVTAAWTAIRALLSGVLSGIGSLFTSAFSAITGTVTGAWNSVRSATGSAWSAVRSSVSGALDAVTSRVRGAFGGILEFMGDLPARFLKAGQAIGRAVINGITDFLSNGVKSVANFAIKILDVVGKIPGVSKITDPAVKGIKEIAGLRKGGAFGRTGGIIDSPIVMMGEEAPLHPEIVVPTNPAYRDRAQMLVRHAAQAVGLAKGGILSRDQISYVYDAVGGSGDAKVMGAIAMGESSGRINAVGNDPGGTQGLGLWQITTGFNDDVIRRFGGRDAMLTNPGANARAADAIYDRQGLGAWVVYNTGAYKQFMGGGGGLLGKIGGALSGAAGAVTGIVGDLLAKGAGFLLGKLPGLGGLPDWLHGLGRDALGAVGSWIKDKVKGLIDTGGGGDSGPGTMTGTNAKAAKLAKMFGATITSSYRSPSKNAAVGGAPGSSHMKGSPANPGAHDFVPASQALINEALKMGAKWVDNHDYGSGLHSHVSWFRKGGIYGGRPVLGSYAQGTPYVPRTGLYELHQGEAVVPAGGGIAAEVRAGLEGMALYATLDGQPFEARIERAMDSKDRADAAAWRAGVA